MDQLLNEIPVLTKNEKKEARRKIDALKGQIADVKLGSTKILDLYDKRGELHFSLLKYYDAFVDTRILYERSDFRVENLLRCGICLYKLNRYEEAIKIAQKGLEVVSWSAKMDLELRNKFEAIIDGSTGLLASNQFEVGEVGDIDGISYDIKETEWDSVLCRGWCTMGSKNKILASFVRYDRDVEVVYSSLESFHNENLVSHCFVLEKRGYIITKGWMVSLRSWVDRKKRDHVVKYKDEAWTKARSGEWLNMILEDLKKIFKSVVEGVIYLYDQNVKFQNWDTGIFVTSDGFGKIIPSMECLRGGETDLLILSKIKDKLESIIRGKFQDFDENALPIELKFYLSVLDGKFAGCGLSCKWLLTSPFLWNVSERIAVLQKISELIQRQVLDQNNLAGHNSFFSTPGPIPSWIDKVTKHPFGVYRDIFTYGYYSTELDAARYMANFIKHYNDIEYRKKYNYYATLEKEDIENQLRMLLPDAYVNIITVINSIALNPVPNSCQIFEALLKCVSPCQRN